MGLSVEIADAGPQHAARLIALAAAFHRSSGHPLSEAQRDAIRALLADRRIGRAWIAHEGSQDLGYATCVLAHSVDHAGRAAALDDLYVVPAWRGRGVGRAIMRRAETDLAESGVRALSLRADPADRRAGRFYRGLGFQASPLVTFEKPVGFSL